jgi:hypothetical protein
MLTEIAFQPAADFGREIHSFLEEVADHWKEHGCFVAALANHLRYALTAPIQISAIEQDALMQKLSELGRMLEIDTDRGFFKRLFLRDLESHVDDELKALKQRLSMRESPEITLGKAA